MIKKAAIAVPLALSLSMAAFADPGHDPQPEEQALAPDDENSPLPTFKASADPRVLGFDATYRTPENFQVRIEQRVIVRISPRRAMPRQSLTAEFADLETVEPPKLVEKKMGDCVDVANIAGVQTGRDDRLLLYLRDRRLVSARLEKSCRARDFYSGFYVERNKDGKLCRKRDKLLSRSGANCEIDRLRQLVEED